MEQLTSDKMVDYTKSNLTTTYLRWLSTSSRKNVVTQKASDDETSNTLFRELHSISNLINP